MNSITLTSPIVTKPRARVILMLILASLVLTYIPILNLLVYPISTFVTAVHETSHAIACLLTGGHVNGLTIVSDGEGHGGLTYCLGGMPFIYAQAGYLGTASFGCLLIALGRLPRLSKFFIGGIGATLVCSSMMFMLKGVLHGDILQAVASTGCGIALAAFFMWSAFKLNPYWANLLLLFIGVECCINSLSDMVLLTQQSLGMMGNVWSDATNMQNMTGLPAIGWAIFWSFASVTMMVETLWWLYKPSKQ